MSLLTLLPIVLSIGFVSAAGMLVVFDLNRSRHACRQSLLQSQQKVRDQLVMLLNMNPKAKLLRMQRKAAEKAYQLALQSAHPPAIASARAVLAAVKLQQKLFHAKQRVHISMAKYQSATARRLVLKDVLLAADSVSRPYSTYGGFHILPTPKNSASPSYHPSKSFSHDQTISAKWHLGLAEDLPTVFHKPMRDIKLNAHCAATVTNKEGRWLAVLTAVK